MPRWRIGDGGSTGRAVAKAEASAAAARDLTPVLEGRAAALVSLVQRQSFVAQQSPQGAPWMPLSETTLALRRTGRGRGAARILRDTGNLARSIYATAAPDSILFGSSGPIYAATHQFGRPGNRMFGKHPAPIPARPFLPVSPAGKPLFASGPALDWVTRLKQRVLAYIAKGTL